MSPKRLKSKDLLARGYLPRELPRSFRSSTFARASGSLTESQIPPREWTETVALNIDRPGNLRRRLGIPNPFSLLALSKICENEWTLLRSHVNGSPMSMTTPRVGDLGGRALAFRKPFAAWAIERSMRAGTARFCLKTDVSQCYGSVYTHSLEWALHGKAASKANLKARGPASVGASLDRAVQAAQSGQTKGVPIGPDTSLLLAEVVLTAIDVELQGKFPQLGKRGFRFIDDFEYFASSRAEAEDVLLAWETALSSFELNLNELKTNITEGPTPPEPAWRTQLAKFDFRTSSERILSNDIRSYFSIAYQFTIDHPSESVMAYALGRLRQIAWTQKTWAAASPLILGAAVSEPSAIMFANAHFAKAVSLGLALSNDAIEESLNGIVEHHSRLEHGATVTWALYMLLNLGLSLTSESASLASSMRDNCSLIVLRDLVARGRVTGTAPTMSEATRRAETSGVLSSSDWLLGYEYARNGWSSDAEVKKHAHWKELLDLGVKFYAQDDVDLRNPLAGGATSPASQDVDEDEAEVTDSPGALVFYE